jgi:carboxyl-terminal processing protease
MGFKTAQRNADAKGRIMTHRTAVSLVLMTALLVPHLHAQDRQTRRPATASTTSTSQQAEVLEGAVRAISRMHREAFSDSGLWEAASDGLIESLNDPYAELFTAQESNRWEEETTGNYSGIGLQITLLQEAVTVTAVFRSFPASEAGIVEGDVIVGVDDADAADWSTENAAQLIRGPAGSKVRVRVQRRGYEEPLEFNITRAEVHVPAVEWGVLESGLGYVVMDRVARGAAEEMGDALEELDETRGLIIDLRRNPGGFLDESLMLADLFLKPGSTLASTVQRTPGGSASSPETDSYSDRWPQRVPDLPIVILVDGFTASGAEILAGALQDYDRALVLGERSFGKGVVQTVMELPHGRRLRFTTGSWLTPLGRSLQRDRDSQGRPVPEVESDYPVVTTTGGRELVNGGGIFPDLDVEEDTLVTAEQELVRVTSEMQFPLALRLTEFGFEMASARRAEDRSASVSDAEFEGFVAELVAEGLPAELTADPVVRHYLHWRARISVAQRLRDVGAEADIRAERDLPLTEAIRLLTTTTSQSALFEAARAEATTTARGTTPPRR